MPPAAALYKSASPFVAGGGVLGELLRGSDWRATPLGPVEAWPQSLSTAIGICLQSAFPILVWWGRDRVMFYNDACRPILGDKHPRVFGQTGRACWPEIWDVIQPMLDRVQADGAAVRADDQPLILVRNGVPEECYFNYSFCPIHDESGGVGGVFCSVIETSDKVIGERRWRLLRDLVALGRADNAPAACCAAAAVLDRRHPDLPFALIYLIDPAGTLAHLAGSAGMDGANPVCVSDIDLNGGANNAAAWPLAKVLQTGRPTIITDPGRWGTATDTALVIPVVPPGADRPRAIMIVGANPRRALDDAYRTFFDLVAAQIGAALADAAARGAERDRAAPLAEIGRANTAPFGEEAENRLVDNAPGGLGVGAPAGLVLVASDSAALRDGLQRLLQAAHYQVRTAADGIAAMDGIRTAKPDLVVTDIMMPGLDGASLLQMVRADPDTRDLPVLLLSTRAGAAALGEWGETGADDFLTTPFSARDLVTRVRAILHLAQQRRAAAAALREREERLRLATAGTGVGTWDIDWITGRAVWSAALIAILGCPVPAEEPADTNPALWQDCLHPDDRAAVNVAIDTARRDHSLFTFEHRIRRSDTGAVRWLAPHGRFLYDRFGAPVRFVGVCLDVTDRKRAEQALRASEDRLYKIALSAPGLICSFRLAPDGTASFPYCGPRVEAFYGIASERLRDDAEPLFARIHPDDRGMVQQSISVSAQSLAPWSGEFRYCHPDKGEIWVEGHSQPVLEPEGSIIWHGYVHDVTERKRAESVIRAREAQFRTLVESMPQLVWSARADGRFDYFNRRWSEFTGRTAGATLGDSETKAGFLPLVHPDDRASAAAAWDQSLAHGAPLEIEYRLRRSDGVYHWFLSRAVPVRDDTGQVLLWLGTCTDIEDQKQAEARQRLLLHELNHRVKNTLSSIQAIACLTFRADQDVTIGLESFQARLIALSQAHDLLIRSHWQGATLGDVAESSLAPFRDAAAGRLTVAGAELALPPKAVLALSLAFHELATNAAKYGALSVATGQVAVTWQTEDRQGNQQRCVRLAWVETGGPPVVAPSRRGFGLRVIEWGLAGELMGVVTLDFAPTGVQCYLIFPLREVRNEFL